jgi:6,7-dimethyl-8-ribityllumazine synthase
MHKGTPKAVDGKLTAKELSFVIIVSRFNESVTTKLLEGCVDKLRQHGADYERIEVIWCPGAFEIPFLAKQAALTGKFDAIICLGAVIRGDTPHFDYVCDQTTRGIGQVGMETNVPTIFGLLTTDNLEQALDRTGGKSGHKGSEAAEAAMEMVHVLKDLRLKYPTNKNLKS